MQSIFKRFWKICAQCDPYLPHFFKVVLYSSILRNVFYRIGWQTGYLSSAASAIAGVFAYLALMPAQSLHVDFIANREVLNHQINLWLSVCAAAICSISMLCYSIIIFMDFEYFYSFGWYIIAAFISIRNARIKWLAYKESRSEGSFPDRGGQDWRIRIHYALKIFGVFSAFFLFLGTAFEAGFRVNVIVKYIYANPDANQVFVLGYNLHFECHCQGSKLTLPACLQLQRKINPLDKVILLEHDYKSNSILERSLIRRISSNLPDYTVCAYDRLNHGWSSREINGYYDVSDQTFRIAEWIKNQNLNNKIIYAGHGSASYNLVWMLLKHPDFVRGLVFIEGGYWSLDNFLEYLPEGYLAVMGEEYVPQYLLNTMGLFNGFAQVVLSSLSYDQFWGVVQSYFKSDGSIVYCEDPKDFTELLANYLTLDYMEAVNRDRRFANSNSMMRIHRTSLERSVSCSHYTL